MSAEAIPPFDAAAIGAQPASKTPARRLPNLSAIGTGNRDDVRHALATASLGVSNPRPSSVDLSNSDVDNAPILLKVTEVQPCPEQPRIFVNESEDEIRASLIAQGDRCVLEVTRLGPGHPYMLSAGGNTRLRIMQDLYRETGSDKWLYKYFIFRRYTGDENLLAQHLAENLARSDMKFYEAATGVARLVKKMEERLGEPISERRLEQLLPEKGISAKRALIGRWLFTAKRLSALDKATVMITGQQVMDKFMPRLNALSRLSAKFGIEGESYWERVVNPTLARVGSEFAATGEFSADSACDAVEVAFAEVVGESVSSVRLMLATLHAAQGNATLADLRQACAAMQHPAPAAASETPPPSRSAAGQPSSSTPTVIRMRGAPQEPSPAEQHSPHSLELPRGTVSGRANDVAAASASTPANTELSITVDSPLTDLPPHGDLTLALQRLHELVRRLMHEVSLANCFVEWEPMPFGFYIEYPNPQEHGMPAGSMEQVIAQRTQAAAVFWSLLKLSGQTNHHNAERMNSNSLFYQAMVDESVSLEFLADTIVGADGPSDEDILVLATRPELGALTKLLQVIVSMRNINLMRRTDVVKS